MIIPVRCMTCNMVLGSKYQAYLDALASKNVDPNSSDEIIQLREDRTPETNTPVQDIFKDLGISRYCCRRHLLAHVDLIDDI